MSVDDAAERFMETSYIAGLTVIARVSRLASFLSKLSRSAGHQYRRLWIRNAVSAPAMRRRAQEFASKGTRFVLFLAHGENVVNGGLISILSIAAESRTLCDNANVAVGVGAGQPRLLRYSQIDNDFDLIQFEDFLVVAPQGAHVLLHVPEMMLKQFITNHAGLYAMRPDVVWSFNILLQNIDLLPKRAVVDEIRKIGPVTATTAHASYASAETAEKIGRPVHHLSTWLSPEVYEHTDYTEKQKLIIVSPDRHPQRDLILAAIRSALPDHRIVEIRKMPYRKYRQLAKSAKFSFTFGEGLDGYFLEPILSGGIGMAIYNDRFFTEEYRGLDGVFGDASEAIAQLPKFMRESDNPEAYKAITARQMKVVAKNYVRAEYLNNIRDFYQTFFPL